MFKIIPINEKVERLLSKLEYCLDSFESSKHYASYKQHKELGWANLQAVFFKGYVKVRRRNNGYTFGFEGYNGGHWFLVDLRYWDVL